MDLRARKVSGAYEKRPPALVLKSKHMKVERFSVFAFGRRKKKQLDKKNAFDMH